MKLEVWSKAQHESAQHRNSD